MIKYTCTVYDNPKKRFQPDGCACSHDLKLDYDAFPGKLEPMKIKEGPYKGKDIVLFWFPILSHHRESSILSGTGKEICHFIKSIIPDVAPSRNLFLEMCIF